MTPKNEAQISASGVWCETISEANDTTQDGVKSINLTLLLLVMWFSSWGAPAVTVYGVANHTTKGDWE
jgi:hypothetical protein